MNFEAGDWNWILEQITFVEKITLMQIVKVDSDQVLAHFFGEDL